MKENCKHEPMNYFDLSGTKHIDAVPKKSKCTFCGVELIATWTVKPKPIKMEFEAYFNTSGNQLIIGPVEWSLADNLAGSGKRFKITAEEIL